MAAHKKAPSRRSKRRPARRASSRRKKTSSRGRKRYWSGRVTRTSHAMDTKKGIFTSQDPDKIADSLLKSARRSKTRKTTPYQSAMSLLNFYENRGGKNLSKSRKHILERAKDSLRHEAGRDKPKRAHASRRKRRS